MKFKILPLLLAGITCQQINAQTVTNLSAFSVKLKSSSGTVMLDTVNYTYNYPNRGVPEILFMRVLGPFPPEAQRIERNNRFSDVSLYDLSFTTAENVRTNTLNTTVRYKKEIKTYNSAGKLIKIEQEPDPTCIYNLWNRNYIGVTKIITDLRYSVSGNIIAKDIKFYPSSVTTLTLYDTFSYNTAGQLIYRKEQSSYGEEEYRYYSGGLIDSIFYPPYISHKYYYNAGKIVRFETIQGNGPYNITREDYSYNSSGYRVKDSISESILGAPFSPSKLNVYDYNTQNDVVKSSIRYWNSVTGTWGNIDGYVYYSDYDANHNLISYYREEHFGSKVWHSNKHLLSYNSNNLLVKYTQQEWDTTTSAWVSPAVDTERNYYYAVYSDIKKVAPKQLQCSIYPVPANAMLNVDISNSEENEIAFELYSTDGRLVRRMVVKTQANGKYAIPVADLSAGTYILHTKCGELENVKQFAVLH